MSHDLRLLLLRHGTTDANEAGLFLGQTDVALNARGRDEVRRLGARLASEPVDKLVSSDLRRARETAEAVAAQQSGAVAVVTEPALREIHLGDLDGRVAREVHAQHPELMARWLADPANVRFPGPGGETLGEVAARAWEAIERLRVAHPGGTVAVVSHTFTLLTILCRALDLDLSRFRQLHLDRASVTVLEWRRFGPTLVGLNDVGHLRP